jgi:hypothetical protein
MYPSPSQRPGALKVFLAYSFPGPIPNLDHPPPTSHSSQNPDME